MSERKIRFAGLGREQGALSELDQIEADIAEKRKTPREPITPQEVEELQKELQEAFEKLPVKRMAVTGLGFIAGAIAFGTTLTVGFVALLAWVIKLVWGA